MHRFRMNHSDPIMCIGHIAKLIGMPRHSRHVGQGEHLLLPLWRISLPSPSSNTVTNPVSFLALKYVSPSATPPVPWQRVVASNGTISSRGPGTDGAQRQKDALEAEGVEKFEASWAELLESVQGELDKAGRGGQA